MKEKEQAGQTPVRPNTDASYDGGLGRSSDEVPVMGMERRAGGCTVGVAIDNPGFPGEGQSGFDKEYSDYQTDGLGSVQACTQQSWCCRN